MIIDAKNQIIGRIATVAAKQALLGYKVDVINAECALMTGDKFQYFEKLRNNDNRGEPSHGPFQPKMPDRLLRRHIRGMLPIKTARGKEALRRIMCHIGVPKQFEGKETTKVKGADVSKVPTLKYVQIKEISKLLGAKI